MISKLKFKEKNIFNITKKKKVLKTFIKILIGIGEIPLIDIFWFTIIILVHPSEARKAKRIPTIFITLKDGPITKIIPKNVTKKRIFTVNEIFSLSTIIENKRTYIG